MTAAAAGVCRHGSVACTTRRSYAFAGTRGNSSALPPKAYEVGFRKWDPSQHAEQQIHTSFNRANLAIEHFVARQLAHIRGLACGGGGGGESEEAAGPHGLRLKFLSAGWDLGDGDG